MATSYKALPSFLSSRPRRGCCFRGCKLIEKYKIRPFKVVLNSFAIVPQLEAIEADLEMIRSLPALATTSW
jgi:hypothetical protein